MGGEGLCQPVNREAFLQRGGGEGTGLGQMKGTGVSE